VLTISTTDGSRPKTGSSHPSRIRSRRIRSRIRHGNGIRRSVRRNGRTRVRRIRGRSRIW
jgi:hypothetical protein